MKLKVALFLSMIGLALAPASALAAGNFANAGLPGASSTNPLAGMTWGVYRGPLDQLYDDWRSAHGVDKKLLAKEALQPLAYWFGSWNQDALASDVVRSYIQSVQNGNPNALVQMAVFRVDPWEHKACVQYPSAEQVASYKDWVDNWALGIGDARVAMILQPDLPFEACEPDHSQVAAQEVAYAAQVFSALPHTTVYLDAGASDWERVEDIVPMLRESGIQYTRGFALGATHYDSTAHELVYGRKVVQELAAAGIPNMHFVINTAQNGKPFTTQLYPKEFRSGAPCTSATEEHCVTLGIPPTYKVAADPTADDINGAQAAIAAKLCDGYLWFGRPWLYLQAKQFMPNWALQLAASSPY